MIHCTQSKYRSIFGSLAYALKKYTSSHFLNFQTDCNEGGKELLFISCRCFFGYSCILDTSRLRNRYELLYLSYEQTLKQSKTQTTKH